MNLQFLTTHYYLKFGGFVYFYRVGITSAIK